MIVPPGDFADRPALPLDALRPPPESAAPPAPDDAAPGPDAFGRPYDLLSELLRSVRLSGERIVEYGPPHASPVGFSGSAALHIVDEGEVVLRVEGGTHAERARGGDVILLPRGDPHRIGDAGQHTRDAGEHAPGAADATAPGPDRAAPGPDSAASGPGSANPGSGSANPGTGPAASRPARWLTGTFTIGDPRASHLLASLPAVIVLRGARGPALEGLEVARRMLLIEMRSPTQGSAVMVARILDLLFIQILRAWAADAGAEPNWLAGALDPEIGPALGAIHRDPGHEWTVEDLARACCLSRSAFAARFADRVGKPPATYLAHVRLDAAADLLRTSSLPVGSVGEKVGYTSEAAFSRAFKHRYGKPPALWRRDARPARSAGGGPGREAGPADQSLALSTGR
jgi:AraC-like DNA-binding protein